MGARPEVSRANTKRIGGGRGQVGGTAGVAEGQVMSSTTTQNGCVHNAGKKVPLSPKAGTEKCLIGGGHSGEKRGNKKKQNTVRLLRKCHR